MNISKNTSSKKKRIIVTIVGLVVVVVLLIGIKGMQFGTLMAQGAAFAPPPESITTAVADLQSWESTVTAIGSFDAVRGVTVSAETPGRVVEINLEAGAQVKAGDLLLQQDITTENASLRAAEADAALAKANLDRSRDLLSQRLISQSEYDTAEARYKAAVAEADNVRTLIEKKTVRAPFDGRLGIRLVNLGENLQEGEEIVSLQLLDPLFINFHIPQRQLADIRLGYTVRATTDALPGQVIEGKITAINPEVDALTRNVRVQATASNPDENVLPGMFANVAIVLPGERKVLAIPITAVQYAPYGDSVFIVEEKRNEQSGETQLVVRQQFVQLGETQGDFITVESGLKQGEVVASTGVFKLRNGQAVVVNNRMTPDYKLKPQPENA